MNRHVAHAVVSLAAAALTVGLAAPIAHAQGATVGTNPSAASAAPRGTATVSHLTRLRKALARAKEDRRDARTRVVVRSEKRDTTAAAVAGSATLLTLVTASASKAKEEHDASLVRLAEVRAIIASEPGFVASNATRQDDAELDLAASEDALAAAVAAVEGLETVLAGRVATRLAAQQTLDDTRAAIAFIEAETIPRAETAVEQGKADVQAANDALAVAEAQMAAMIAAYDVCENPTGTKWICWNNDDVNGTWGPVPALDAKQAEVRSLSTAAFNTFMAQFDLQNALLQAQSDLSYWNDQVPAMSQTLTAAQAEVTATEDDLSAAREAVLVAGTNVTAQHAVVETLVTEASQMTFAVADARSREPGLATDESRHAASLTEATASVTLAQGAHGAHLSAQTRAERALDGAKDRLVRAVKSVKAAKKALKKAKKKAKKKRR